MTKVTVDDGVEIHYYLDDYTNPWDEECETILMHHGSGENSKFYIPIAHALARRYRVLRFDARGRGESSAPPEGSTFSGEATDDSPIAAGERCVKDVLSLMDHLGIDKVHWFGVSSGGVIGIPFAVQHPNRLKSLILCTTPYTFPRGYLASLSYGERDPATAIEKLGNSEFWRRGGLFSMVLDSSKAEKKMLEWELAQRQKIPTHIYSAFWKWVQSFDYAEWLPKIKTPTLILAAEHSKIQDPEMQQFMQRQIPNSKLVVFEGVGHSIHMLMPERCAEAVVNFVQSIA